MKSIINSYFKFLLVALFAIMQNSCKKFLDEKSSKSLIIPRSVQDLQGVLDGDGMNEAYPQSGIVCSDDFYLTGTTWASVPFIEERNSYIWDKGASNDNDWYYSYQRIFKSNAVLDELPKLKDEVATTAEWNNVKGSAYFFRAFNFYELAQIYAPQYSVHSAPQNLGIPLRLKSDIEDISVRSTVQETYDRIIIDAKESIRFLPLTSNYKTRPIKPAAYALLARTYLVMGDFANAGKYADSALQIYDDLLDYNTDIDVNAPSGVFQKFNKEVIFHAETRIPYSLLYGKVDTTLYSLYAADDLRKAAFFLTSGSTSTFKGSYTGKARYFPFQGFTTDELYLIKAECFARTGNIPLAMTDLNTLLIKRWAQGTFVPYTATNITEALNKILLERRKELCYRTGLRWSDLRRLNLDSNYQTTLKRALDTQTYILSPGDLNYTFLIPLSVIGISGMMQNPR